MFGLFHHRCLQLVTELEQHRSDCWANACNDYDDNNNNNNNRNNHNNHYKHNTNHNNNRNNNNNNNNNNINNNHNNYNNVWSYIAPASVYTKRSWRWPHCQSRTAARAVQVGLCRSRQSALWVVDRFFPFPCVGLCRQKGPTAFSVSSKRLRKVGWTKLTQVSKRQHVDLNPGSTWTWTPAARGLEPRQHVDLNPGSTWTWTPAARGLKPRQHVDLNPGSTWTWTAGPLDSQSGIVTPNLLRPRSQVHWNYDVINGKL